MEMNYLDKLMDEENKLYDRLDNLEGCEDNPVYAKEIEEIRDKITEINAAINTEQL